MSVCSFSFLLVCSVAVILFHLCPWKSLRRLFLTCINLAFLVTLVPNRQSWICFAGFLLGTYLVLRFLKARPSRDHLLGLVGFTVYVFIYLKRYEILGWVMPWEFSPDVVLSGVELVGLSYMLFKMIHMAVDQLDGQLAPYGLFSYLNYQLAFFTLLAGPIQRYNDFQESWEHMDGGASDARDTLRFWNRILTGMLQMGLVAALLWEVFEGASKTMLSPNSMDFLQGMARHFYVYPLYLYFNFAGYTNIAIGSAGLFGFRVPENFNHPFIARNMIDFWNRWHMSLSQWIRDYVFMTSYKACAERFPRWSRPCAYFLLFLALFIAGMWHGTTLAFAAVGVSFGIGVAGTQIYGDLLRARLGHAGFHRYMQNQLIHTAAIVITFHYVCFSILFMSSGVSDTLFMLHHGMELMGSPGQAISSLRFAWWPVGVAAALGLLAIAWWKQNSLAAFVDWLKVRMPRTTNMLYAALFAKAVLTACVLLAYWALQQKDPVIVYIKF